MKVPLPFLSSSLAPAGISSNKAPMVCVQLCHQKGGSSWSCRAALSDLFFPGGVPKFWGRQAPLVFRPRHGTKIWVWLNIKQEGLRRHFGPCVHLPGSHFRYRLFEPRPYHLYLDSQVAIAFCQSLLRLVFGVKCMEKSSNWRSRQSNLPSEILIGLHVNPGETHNTIF